MYTYISSKGAVSLFFLRKKTNEKNKKMGLIDTVVGAGMGIATGAYERGQQTKQNQDLIDQQIEAQKQIAKNNRIEQMKMWNETNYKAQVNHMKAAGLNVGLMYGTGGGGGSTTANVGTGSASGGAPGRNDITENIGMALQARLQKAQIENIEADTKKKESETKGVDLANKWEDLLQGKDLFDENGHSLKERRYRVEVNELLNKIAVGDAQINKLDKQLLQIGVDMRKGEAEIKRILEDTQLMEQLKKFQRHLKRS